MLSCKETSRFVSERRDHFLPPWKRFLVHMHLKMCRTCGYYHKQIVALKKIFPHYPGPGDSALSSFPAFPEDSRWKLKRLLEQQS